MLDIKLLKIVITFGENWDQWVDKLIQKIFQR